MKLVRAALSVCLGIALPHFVQAEIGLPPPLPFGSPFVPSSWQGPRGANGVLPQAGAIQAVAEYLAARTPVATDWCEPVTFLYDPFGPDTTLPAGTHVADEMGQWQFVHGTFPWYLGFVDAQSRSEWQHPAQMLLIHGQSGVVLPCDVRMPIRLDGRSFRPFDTDAIQPAILLSGSYPPDTAGDVVLQVDAGVPSDNCAVIITGHNQSGAGEAEARRKDTERMKKILHENPMGPRIPLDRIKVANGGPSFNGATLAEAISAIQSLNGCDTIYFVYLGHGGPDGDWYLTDPANPEEGTSTKYVQLYEALAALPHQPRTVHSILESCYSGGAVIASMKRFIERWMMWRFDGPNWLNGTFLTSSGELKTTPRIDFDGTPFVKALERASRDPGFDLNRDGRMDLFELGAGAQAFQNMEACGMPDYRIARIADQYRVADGPKPLILGSVKRLDAPVEKSALPGMPPTYLGTTPYRLGVLRFGNMPLQPKGDRPPSGQVRRNLLFIENTSDKPIELRPTSPEPEVTITVDGARSWRRDVKISKPITLQPGERAILADLGSHLLADGTDATGATIEIPARGLSARIVKPSARTDPADVDPAVRSPLAPLLRFVYAPGSPICNAHVLPLWRWDSLPGVNVAAVTARGPLGWGIHLDEDSTAAPHLLSDSLGLGVLVRGTVPVGAGEGGLLQVVATEIGTGAEVTFSALALLHDSRVTSVDRGEWRARYLVLQDLGVADTVARFESCAIVFGSNGSASVDPEAVLCMRDVSAHADVGHTMAWDARGIIDWDDCSFVAPSGGLRFTGARGRLRQVHVSASSGPGMRFEGALDSLRVDHPWVDDAAAEGLLFDGALGVTVRSPVIRGGTGPGLRLVRGSRVALVDDPEWASGGHLAVGDSSRCFVKWSTFFRCFDIAGAPAAGAHVSAQRGPVLEFFSTTDSSGSAGIAEIAHAEVRSTGSIPLGPTVVTVEFADWDTTFAVTVDTTAYFDIRVPRLAGVLGPWTEAPVRRLRLGAPYPNPAAGLVRCVVELPARQRATLEVLDVQGRIVRRLDAGVLEAGRHVLKLGTEGLRPSLYFLQLRVAGQSTTRRLILL